MPLPPANDETDIARHFRALEAVTDCPIRPGNKLILLPSGIDALRGMFTAIREARSCIVLEFYTLEDVALDGQALSALLKERLAAGVRVALIYDAIGSSDMPDAILDDLQAHGAAVMPFRSVNPLRRFFSLRINDRDHRKILVVDGKLAFVGGVNIDRQYLNPPEAGIPPDRDTRKAFWRDAAACLVGPVVADAQALFHHTWRKQGGTELPPLPDCDSSEHADGELICVEGSSPREGRPLHTRALAAALKVARRHVWIATGYFVPMADELRALAQTAQRGVDVRLVLPGVSDLPAAIHAARATYGKLLEAGVKVYELHQAVLHAKVSTVDSVWTSIGSSNFDRRSAILNNEVDAIVLGERTAAAVETMFREWLGAARAIDLDEWRGRSRSEHLGELTALLWKRLM